MAFDSPELLEHWHATGEFPAIHTPMARAARAVLKGPNVLDLCCNSGLLATQIARTVPQAVRVVGVEGSHLAVSEAKHMGIPIYIHVMRIEPATVQQFYYWLTATAITSIVARRAFPELFRDNMNFGRNFVEMIHKLGVKEILLQGRQENHRTKDLELSNADKEVALLAGQYTLKASFNQGIRYLTCHEHGG